MPRKSAASAAGEGDTSINDGISVEDLGLPRTMVHRLAKGMLPPNTQIHKDALLAIQKSATVFISYLASHSNENTLRGNKKTIQPQDVLDALQEIEFESFYPRLHDEHLKFSSIQNDKRNSYRRKVKEEKLAAAARFADEHTSGTANTNKPPSSPADDSFVTANGSTNGVTSPVPTPGKRDGGDEPSAAKKLRRSEGAETDAEMEDEEQDEDEEQEDDDDGAVSEGAEDEDEGDGADQLVEDPLEERDGEEEESEGDESD